MSETIKAVYENGTLVLDEPLSISNGSTVDIVVVSKDQIYVSNRSVAKSLAEIADLPLEGSEKFSGRDHDQILYGKGIRK